MQKKLHLLFALLIFFVSQAMAQITTSSLSGKITANNEDVIGATIKVTHEPSGTVYGATTNANGLLYPGFAAWWSLQSGSFLHRLLF